MSGEPGTGETYPTKKEQLAASTKLMAEAFSKALNPTDLIERGSTRTLPKPIVDSFGSMSEQKDYDEGCSILHVTDFDKGVVVLSLVDNDVRRVVKIGRVPKDFDPTQGGVNLEDSGIPGEYLMAVQKIDPNQPAEKPKTRYVDRADLEGIIVKKGEPVHFNPNPQRGRQLAVNGTVQTVSRLK